jgi:hypothetical protein
MISPQRVRSSLALQRIIESAPEEPTPAVICVRPSASHEMLMIREGALHNPSPKDVMRLAEPATRELHEYCVERNIPLGTPYFNVDELRICVPARLTAAQYRDLLNQPFYDSLDIGKKDLRYS